MKIPSVLTNNLREKMENALNTNDNIEIVLTDQELASIIASGFSFQNFAIRDEQVQMSPGGMLVYGTLAKPFKAKVIMTIVPEIKNGSIYFGIKRMSAGKIIFPEFVNKQASESFTSSVNNKLSLVYSRMEILSLNLLDGKIIINGRVK